MVDLSKLGTKKKITAEEMSEKMKGYGQEQSREERRQEEREREGKPKKCSCGNGLGVEPDYKKFFSALK